MPRMLNEEANISDYLLGLDDLQQPQRIDMSIIRPGEWNSAVLIIARLILMRKGQLDDHPEMGIDIRGRYRFSFDSELVQLSQEIQEQVAQYAPEFAPVDVMAIFKDKNGSSAAGVEIAIVVSNVAYSLLYNLQSETIEGLEGLG